MNRRLQVLLLLALFATLATAMPIFTTVNEGCPLLSRENVTCPILCVTSRDLCPASVRPTCPPGTQVCNDGTNECRASCAGIENVCLCGFRDATTNLVPCATGSVKVSFTEFDPKNGTAQIEGECARVMNLQGVRKWETREGAQMMWAGKAFCPVPPTPRPDFTQPQWLVPFTVLGAEVLLFVLWNLYKRFRERGVKPLSNGGADEGSVNEKAGDKKVGDGDDSTKSSDEDEVETMTIKGYRNDYFGTFVFGTVCLISVGWFVYLSVLSADYYGSVTGTALGLFETNWDIASGVFIAVFYAAAIWLGTVTIARKRIRNFFRIACPPTEGNVVQIEREQKATILLDEKSAVLDAVHWAEDVLKRATGWHVFVATCPIEFTEEGRKYFNFQCTRYVYNNGRFEPYAFDLGQTNDELWKHANGLTDKDARWRQELIGPNFITVDVPNFVVALFQEFASFFYLYQAMMLWLFYYYAYYQVGLVDTIVILISAIIKVAIRLRSELRIKQMAEHVDEVRVLRDGKWAEKVSTADLVPGDVFEITEKRTVPVDAILLAGNVVVDESSLTGEPLPIRKFPLRDEPARYDRHGANKINTLYAGTIVSQSTPVVEGEKVRALVTHTGTQTDKGQLVRKILFPSPVSFIFNEQLKVVLLILLTWGAILFGLAIYLMRAGGGAAWLYGMYCICQILSPLLPAGLVVGQSVASSRLRSKNIYCVDLPRIMIAGKVQIFCFDKTGTLTKEGLEFHGATPVAAGEKGFEFEKKEVTPVVEQPYLMRLGLATCHTVTTLDNQLIGNPVDIEMFRATGWNLATKADDEFLDTIQPPKEEKEILQPAQIVKRFEFVHARASMSVAVLDPTTKHVHIFIKGSFEKVKELARPSSVPGDYDIVCSNLAREGCYVLAMAHRDLGEINLDEVRGMTREQLEEGADMLGLVVFKNNLKDDTYAAIKELKEGSTRTVMITGDNALTGIYIAKQCGMIPEGDRVLLADVHPKTRELFWCDVDDHSGTHVNVDEILNHSAGSSSSDRFEGHSGVELAVTGKAFDYLVENNLIRKYLFDIRVFARMTPAGKVQCVQLHMERGITAMCGDGGNDAGALRASHAGIALSEAEASIVSPFSTNRRTIMSCVTLLKEGRSALATSFAAYKYLIMYGETMAVLRLFAFYFSVSFSQAIWIMFDSLITVVMAGALVQAKATSKLAPVRPTARLLGPQTLVSTISQVALNFIFQGVNMALLRSQPWYRCHEFDSQTVDISKWWLIGDNYETETIGLTALFQFCNAAAVFNFGHHFRKAWFKNYWLVSVWVLYLALISWATVGDPNRFGCWMRINCGDPDTLVQLGYQRPDFAIETYNSPIHHNVFPWDFRWKLWGLCMANCFAGILFERLVVLGPVREMVKRRWPLKRLKLKL
ncbi:uncharacterized protein VTP21DRAFT_10222 [Calcarisporiella thermophila]|uniref:uncharacterized protein n=1 Tax=Calcarisporiella thermophila TaxID=911321 RepID=UPI0037445DC1